VALARFFDRIYASAGRVLSISRENLQTVLAQKTVALACGPDCLDTGNDRWTAELTINLLARLYPSIHLRSSTAVRDHLTNIAKRINPGIDIADPTSPATVTVAVGSAENLGPNTAHIQADGWVARFGLQRPTGIPRGPPNPYAAGVAASLGAWHVFRRVFAEHVNATDSRPLNVSLLDFGESAGVDMSMPDADLGSVAFVGLGAVANGALWAMSRHEGLRGAASLVDPQCIDVSNLQRYVLAFDSDEHRQKASLAEKALSSTKVSTTSFAEQLDVFADRFSAGLDIPTICISVDNIENRRAAQALLPRLIVNGCTSDSGLGVSWHEFGATQACLACLYQPHKQLPSRIALVATAFGLTEQQALELTLEQRPLTDAEFEQVAKGLGLSQAELSSWRGKPLDELYTDLVCGSVQLNLKNIAHAEAVPLAHQSTLAGILMACELLKRTNPKLEQCSQKSQVVQLIDVRLNPPPAGHWVQEKAAEACCICRDPIYRGAYSRKWRNSTAKP